MWPVTVALVVIFLGSAALAKLQPGPFSRWAPGAESLREPALVAVAVVVVFALLAYPVRRVVRWAGTRYVLTSQRLLVRRGLFSPIKEVHVLEQVQEVRPVQNWRQRMVGSGDLQLHMYAGPLRTVREVPFLNRFNAEIQQLWTQQYRASFQRTTQLGSYAGEVGMTEKEQRKLGRDY